MDKSEPASRTRSANKGGKEREETGTPYCERSEVKRGNENDQWDSLTTEYKTPEKAKKPKGKIRTPSGQIIGTSVKDIRNFFQQTGTKKIVKSGKTRQSNSQYVQHDDRPGREKHSSGERHNRRSTTSVQLPHNTTQPPGTNTSAKQTKEGIITSTKENKSKCEKATNTKVRTAVNTTPTTVNSSESTLDKTVTIQINMKETTNGTEASDTQKLLIDKNKRMKVLSEKLMKAMEIKVKQQQQIAASTADADKEDELIKNTLTEESALATSEEETESLNNEKMDVKLVVQMFQQLRKEIKNNVIPMGKDRVDNIEQQHEEIAGELKSVVQELEDTKIKNQMLTNTVVRMGSVMNDMAQRITNLELNNMRKSVVVTGFNTTRKKDDCIANLLDFLYTEMSIQPDILDVFFTSPKSTNPMVITLATLEDKLLIYRNSSKLKDLVNPEGQGYFFSDYLPAELNEIKRCERELYKKNAMAEQEEKMDMEWRNGRLRVNGNMFKKPIVEPKNEELLQLSVEALDEIFAVELTQSKTITLMNSSFIGYAIQTNSKEEVLKAYQKIRLLHGGARHIVLAFRLITNEPYESESFCDDGEHGAGRILLKCLKENDFNSIATFVVRYYGGTRMGPDRFTCFLDATMDVAKKCLNIEEIEKDNTQETVSLDEGTGSEISFKPVNKKKPHGKRNTNPKYGNQNLSQRRGNNHRVYYPPRGRGRGSNPQNRRRHSETYSPARSRSESNASLPKRSNQRAWTTGHAAADLFGHN